MFRSAVCTFSTEARVLTSLSPWLEISVSAVVPLELAPTSSLMSGGSGEGVVMPRIANGEGVVAMVCLCFEPATSKLEGQKILTKTANLAAQQVIKPTCPVPRVCINSTAMPCGPWVC